MNHLHQHQHHYFRLGHRLPEGRGETAALAVVHAVAELEVPTRVIEQRSEESSTSTSSSSSSPSCTSSAQCEKPVSSSSYTLPIVLGIVIPLVAALILFVILQRRHVRKQREEDANDRHASLDFGMGEVSRSVKGRKAAPVGDVSEKGKSMRAARQMSMDLVTMTNPYLLPPELQNSRESLHSLSRTLKGDEDPYRQISNYPSDGASIRSHGKGPDGASIYTASSTAPSRLQEFGTEPLVSNAAAMSRVPPQNTLPKDAPVPYPVGTAAPNQASFPSEPPQVHLPDGIGALAQRKAIPEVYSSNNLAPQVIGDNRESVASGLDLNLRHSNNYLGSFIDAASSSPTPPPQQAPVELEHQPASRMSPPAPTSLPANPRPARKESIADPEPTYETTFMDDVSDYGDEIHVTPPSPTRMREQRYSMDVPPEEFAKAGLGAPGFDPKRLSMGFRPLPPDAVNEVDDPEVRANRIRSFYKEYFDDSKPAPQGEYYEDYDSSYLGDAAAYYEPETNNFVLPYAQPVTRRAMTPPPRAAPRFRGPPPRGNHGSTGGLSAGGMNGGPPRGRPMHANYDGPRASSSASMSRGGTPGPKRPLPPPVDLNSIPTPSKLRDDSFALMGAIDFAPPPTYRDRVAGRSESPLGERRPYSPAVPAFKPVVSSYDDLSPMPSPHLLRRSGTFTALDFAPPKKFRDPDTMSDSGSIRSNRSGVSARQQNAIRNGAYRVSRIPADVVNTKDDMASVLKPQWGMRVGA